MKEYLKKTIKKIYNWHQLYQQQLGDTGAMGRSVTDLVFGMVSLLFLYTAFVFGMIGIGGLGANKSLIIVPIAAVVWTISLYKYGAKLFIGNSNKISKEMYDWRRKLHDRLVILALTIEMFILYLFVSALIPGMTFTLKSSGYTFASGGVFLFIVGIIFIFIQPLVEGVLVRGYATQLVNTTFKDTNSALIFIIPVVAGTVVHSIGALTWPVMFFALYQSVAYQLIFMKYGFKASVWVNILINIMMFSLL